MDTALSGDRLNEERAFVKRYTEGLADTPVEYPGDYSTPLEDRPRKVHVVNVQVAAPPELKEASSSQDTTVSLVIKSLKPSLTIPLSFPLTESVLALKTLITQTNPSVPAPDAQRLLLKGKGLVDAKLLKEYDIADGSIIHLVYKPVAPTEPTVHTPTTTHRRTASDAQAFAANDLAKASSPNITPSLVITTDLPGQPSHPVSWADTEPSPLGPQPQISSVEFHATIQDPTFWEKIHGVCKDSFVYEDDADAAWETFLVSMKARLSAGEAAKIRDVVGINGMGGGA